MKKYIKNVICGIICLSLIFSLVGCFTPSKTPYLSKAEYDLTNEADANAVSQITNAATEKSDLLKDIKYTYDFYVEYQNNDKTVKLGTKNVISIKDRGLPTMTAHRSNSYSSMQNGTANSTKSEDFYYSAGSIYTKRFGKNYTSQLPFSDFLEYTEYSDISVDTDFLDEIFFDKAVVYKCYNNVTEIVFSEALSYLSTAIISFIGLDKTDYKYEISDILLTDVINGDGILCEKYLKYKVSYYKVGSESNVITYYGTFSYKIDATEGFDVALRPQGINYTSIPHIELLSSLSVKGYEVLFDHAAISATYEKSIKVTDTDDNEYIYNSMLDVRSLIKDGKYYYSSIDTEYLLKDYPTETDEKSHDTVGIFIGDHGYSERKYDYVKGEQVVSTDKAEHDYTSYELYSIMNAALGSEQIAEAEIYSFSILGEDADTVTYSVIFTNSSTKYFAGYLINIFLSESINVDNYAFQFDRCDITITVRKSDGCLLKQTIDYKGAIFQIAHSEYVITVEGKCSLTVNSTEDNFDMLTEQDYNNEVNSNK